jgi:hypothetical protein
VRPALAILLDDRPDTILARISSFREPSPHHILERDRPFLSVLQRLFLERFRRAQEQDGSVPRLIIELDGRPAMQVADEAETLIVAALGGSEHSLVREGWKA